MSAKAGHTPPNNTMPETISSRPLGAGEKIIWLLDRACRFSFITHAEIEGGLTVPALAAGLAAAQARHPLLRARIERRGRSGLVFVCDGPDPIPLRELAAGGDDWSRAAEDEMAAPFPDGGPPARCALVRTGPDRSVVLLSLHHSIGDGMSGVYLARDVLAAAGRALTGEPPALPPLGLAGPLEDRLPGFARGLAGARSNAGFALDLVRGRLRLGPASRPRPDGMAPAGTRRIHLERRVIEPEEVRRLSDRCRRRGVTVHGALASALMEAVGHDLGLDRPRPFLLGSDVDLRSRLVPPVGDDVGFFISAGVTWHRAGPGRDFWEVAGEVSAALHATLDRGRAVTGLPLSFINLGRILAPLGTGPAVSRACAAWFERANLGMIVLSNLGRVELGPTGPLAVRSLGFASSFSTTTSIALHALTLDDRLALDLTTMTPVISADHARRLADLTVSGVRAQL